MSSSFGILFRVTTFGESHGRGVGAVIDGCPPQMPLDETDIQPQLDRRRPAQSKLTTSREEADRISILSGVQNGKTLGTPIALMVKNTDQRPADYDLMRTVPRPSHADYTYQMKYGIRAMSGGGACQCQRNCRPGWRGCDCRKIFIRTLRDRNCCLGQRRLHNRSAGS